MTGRNQESIEVIGRLHDYPNKMWAAILPIAGIVLGAALGFVFGSIRAHADWVNEQKRLEYRQLIDQLFQTMTIVIESRPNLNLQNLPEINKAVTDLHRVFNDRLFIADELKKARVMDDFLEMKKVIFYEPELQAETPKDLRYSTTNVMMRENKLREKILEVASTDIVKLRIIGLRGFGR